MCRSWSAAGYALRHYTGDVRGTRDLDVFVRRRDARRLLDTLAALGLETDLTFPHWLGKARLGSESIDVIYSSGNGVAAVDDDWFAHAVPATVLGVRVELSPPEEMIWSKAFVMERERFDGADIAHLLRRVPEATRLAPAGAPLRPHWRVLFGHLVLFGFVYPSERGAVPASVMRLLGRRLTRERREPAPEERVCQRHAAVPRAVPDRRVPLGLRRRPPRAGRRDDPGGRGAVDGGDRVRGEEPECAWPRSVTCTAHATPRARSRPCSRPWRSPRTPSCCAGT